MLRLEATPRAKFLCLSGAAGILMFAVLGLFLFIPRATGTPLSGAERLDVWCNIFWSLLMLVWAALYLYDHWYRGRIHTRIIANSRTLAVSVPGRPVQRIKRSECTGTSYHGGFFLMIDGSKRRIQYPLALFGREQSEFLPALYRTWWPGRNYRSESSC